MDNEQNKTFIEKFDNFGNYGFHNLTQFDHDAGFSVKKKSCNNYVTLLSIYIPNEIFYNAKIEKKPLNIQAFYGEETREGIRLRAKPKLTEPVDAEFHEYFYNIRTKELYKNNKKITADQLINEVYNTHTKSTKLIKGFYLRMKIMFWRILIKSIFEFISKFCHFVLFIISGNRYSYEPICKEEILNGKIIKSQEVKEVKEDLKESKKFPFLGYNTSRWSIIFYSSLHLVFYTIFMYINYKPKFITTILKNNFLTLVYVILSLWLIESLVPKFLMLLIKYFSQLSINCRFKTIKL